MSNEIREYNWNVVESCVIHHNHKYLMELAWIRIDNIWQINKTSFWNPLGNSQRDVQLLIQPMISALLGGH